jgi:zinc/manganese transport system substrate-binding protein
MMKIRNRDDLPAGTRPPAAKECSARTGIRGLLLAALLAALILCAAPTASAGDAINVVTTIPDLADMAREIGRDLVSVKSITRGTEDMHMVPMKPSYLLMLNKADVLLEMGLDMEHAWLPDLLYNCRNDRIQPGAPGFVNCSDRIDPIEVPDTPNRIDGDMHPEGNPHFNTDPHNGRRTAVTVCDGLCRAHPEHAAAFRSNLDDYLKRFDRKLREWEVLARPLAGVKIVSYHKSWGYFAQTYGLDVVGEIELAPGVAPTPAHLAKLVRLIESEKVALIIKEHYYSDRYPRFLEEKTGVAVVTLPNMSGGSPQTAKYFDFIEHNIKTVLSALGKPVLSRQEIEKELEKMDAASGGGA